MRTRSATNKREHVCGYGEGWPSNIPPHPLGAPHTRGARPTSHHTHQERRTRGVAVQHPATPTRSAANTRHTH